MKASRLFPFFLAFVMGAAVFAQSPAISDGDKEDVVKSIAGTLERNAFVPGADFNKVDAYLAEEKPAIDKAATDDEFRAAVNRALHKLGLSHVVLFTPKMLEQRRTQATVGIGVQVSLSEKTLLIARVMRGTPAEEAKLSAGDVVVEVDGKAPEVITALGGAEGTKVKIKVKTFEGKVRDLTLTRRKFSTAVPATITWPDAKTAVLTIPTFDLSYDRARVENLMKGTEKAQSLIIDLRNNPGGVVTNMTHLLGLLIPSDKVIGTYITKRVVKDYITETKASGDDLVAIAKWGRNKIHPMAMGPVFPGSITVLVNHASGSAAEMAAEALRETVDASVVGEKSAGMVLVSILGSLPHGFQLQYPIMDYITVEGKRLEGAGVTPDLAAKDPTIARRDVPDPALDTAVMLSHRYQLRIERFGTD